MCRELGSLSERLLARGAPVFLDMPGTPSSLHFGLAEPAGQTAGTHETGIQTDSITE